MGALPDEGAGREVWAHPLDCSAAAWLTAHRASAVGDHTTGSCPNYLKGSAPDWGLREGGTSTVEAGRSEAYTGLEQPHTLPGHLPGQGHTETERVASAGQRDKHRQT